ncbi:MAG: 5-oxoprolinase subunit PxpB [Gemmatimonadales bacterium]|nr:5-oxoprolinase subunit PxpB [Gemmatimonadales bacterium]
MRPRLAPHGDAGIVIRYGARLQPGLDRVVRHHASVLEAGKLAGVIELVPGYVSLTVHFDPAQTSFEELRDRILPLLTLAPPTPTERVGRTVVIPVQYDGMDLDEVARAAGITVAEVIDRHTAPEYQVALLGFVPGFAYLEPLDPCLVLPRRATPRSRVPAGSVAIAGAQTGVYPAETPGGWLIIGTTSLRLFDPDRQPPALLTVGDRVRFEASGG